MDPKDWRRININWRYLKRELQLDDGGDILNSLFERRLLDESEYKHIKNTSPEREKVEELLFTLKRKPPDLGAYKCFCEVVREIQSHVVDRLAATPDEDDSSQAEPPKTEDVIREALLGRFINREGLTCSLPDLKGVIRDSVKAAGVNYDWGDKQLRDFITKVFTNVTWQQRSKKDVPYFRNIHLRTASHLVSKPSALSIPNDVEQMSVGELCNFLNHHLTIEKKDEVIETCKRESITGEVLLSLKEKDISILFPTLNFGQTRTLDLLISKCMSASPGTENTNAEESEIKSSDEAGPPKENPSQQTLRQFENPVETWMKYVKGNIVNTDQLYRGNMIQPVKHFVYFPQSTNLLENMAEETVAFAAACMNERINGTIYFGISPDGSLELHPGEVVGYNLDKDKCRCGIKSKINFAFSETLHEIVNKVIREPIFVEVVDRAKSDSLWYVVEIDVVPASLMVKHEVFLVRSKFPSGKKNKQRLFRYSDGRITRLDNSDTVKFSSNIVQQLTALRQAQEDQTQTKPVPNLRRKFLNLFTGGSDTLEDDVYPILLFSPLEQTMDASFIEENLSFVKDIDATAVFDFDPKSDTKGLYHYVQNENRVMQVLTTDNFDKNGTENPEKDKHTAFLDNLQTSPLKTWTFCNGYECLEKYALDPYEWKQKRIEGFRGAVQFHQNNIPQGRALVLVFLFSTNYEVMLEAADEILTKFKDQWIVLAENDTIADLWKEQMIVRHCANTESLQERCVLGIPWKHLNGTICQVLNSGQTSSCLLPTSKGMFCSLRQRVKDDMSDLDILSAEQCNVSEIIDDNRKKEKKRREVEEHFFRGGQVDWWNFWFSGDHVLKRDCHENLLNEVTASLNATEETDIKVKVVTLLHQPGAGGTTSARQILWDLKDKYRCCEVKQITDQTSDEIATLRCYEDPDNPKPPLVLIDNHDDEKLSHLYAVLEDKARISARSSSRVLSVFCVLLVCQRRPDFPIQCESRKVLLKHELTKKELAWFERKNAVLEKKFTEDKRVNPKHLISFNILKENFNKNYMRRTVETFVNDIKDEKELKILKYLALLNTYDIDFTQVPVASFDPLMRTSRNITVRKGHERTYSRHKGWETFLSSSLRVLLNMSSRSSCQGKKEQTLRIIHILLAKEILCSLAKKLKETIVDIMSQFLCSSVFLIDSACTKRLLNIIRNIIKKRRLAEDDRKEKFSPFVLAALENVDIDKTVNIMIKVFEMTEDAILAQQIARFYMHCKNWENAERYATIATNKWYRNSFLWDTLAMVYKEQLYEEYVQSLKTDTPINKEQAKHIIGIAFKAIEIFRKEQQLSEKESSAVNNAGYFGEIRVIILLLNTFPRFQCYTGKEDMHKLLVTDKFVPDSLRFVGEANIAHLKQMQGDASKALRRLDEEYHQLKSVMPADFVPKDAHLHKDTLIGLKENLDEFFGEGTDIIPPGLTAADVMAFRRRRADRHGVTSLAGAFRVVATDEGSLFKAYKLMIENVKSPQANAYDFVALLNTCVAQHVMVKGRMFGTFQEMVEWSKRLYDLRDQQGTRPYLETFLYLVLFNLPTEDRHMYTLCASSKISEAIKLWKEAFYNNHSRQKDGRRHLGKKDATYFFLGRGKELEGIVYYEELHGWNGGKSELGDRVWRTETAINRLKRMKGVLRNDGLEVNMQLQSAGGNVFNVSVPTSLPIGKRSLWQKTVYFVLGFGWSGPKAYDVTAEDVEERTNVQSPQTRGKEWIKAPRVTPPAPRSLESIMKSIEEIEEELETLKQSNVKGKKMKSKRQDLEKQLKTLHRERDDLLGIH